jgi:hypothetical protein
MPPKRYDSGSPAVDDCHRSLFRREDVEGLRREHRRTAPQMAKLLGISRSQIAARIRQGKLKPVSGPGISGCGHYLFIRGSGSYQTVE